MGLNVSPCSFTLVIGCILVHAALITLVVGCLAATFSLSMRLHYYWPSLLGVGVATSLPSIIEFGVKIAFLLFMFYFLFSNDIKFRHSSKNLDLC